MRLLAGSLLDTALLYGNNDPVCAQGKCVQIPVSACTRWFTSREIPDQTEIRSSRFRAVLFFLIIFIIKVSLCKFLFCIHLKLKNKERTKIHKGSNTYHYSRSLRTKYLNMDFFGSKSISYNVIRHKLIF